MIWSLEEPMTREKLLKEIKNIKETKNRNIMGCSENWYNPYYAINKVFTKEEIKAMSDKEVDDLYRLANTIQECLY